ncbi:unnamed protein product [Arctogadus glacialis]
MDNVTRVLYLCLAHKKPTSSAERSAMRRVPCLRSRAQTEAPCPTKQDSEDPTEKQGENTDKGVTMLGGLNPTGDQGQLRGGELHPPPDVASGGCSEVPPSLGSIWVLVGL